MVAEFFKIGLKSEAEYRFHLIMQIFFQIIPVLVTCFIWVSVYNNGGSSTIGGLTKSEMVGYILLTNIVYSMIGIDSLDISREIQSGNISNYFIKPMNYLVYKSSLYLSSILVASLGYLPPVISIFIYYKVPFHKIIMLFILLVEAIAINLLVTYLLSSLTFWIYSISSVFYLFNFVMGFFAGTLIPVNIYPAFIRRLNTFLPFKNMGYEVSASIFINSTKEAASSILNGFVWIVILLVLTKIVWGKGSKRYEAFGG